MASKDQKSLLEAYSQILGENIGTEEENSELSVPVDANPELGGHAKSLLANSPASEVKHALKELMRYKRPNHSIDDEVIDSITDEELASLQDFLDKQLSHAKIAKVASESVNTSSYLNWMR
jgi:hypothetical protein